MNCERDKMVASIDTSRERPKFREYRAGSLEFFQEGLPVKKRDSPVKTGVFNMT